MVKIAPHHGVICIRATELTLRGAREFVLTLTHVIISLGGLNNGFQRGCARSRSVKVHKPPREQTQIHRIKTQLWRDKEHCVYTVIYIQGRGGGLKSYIVRIGLIAFVIWTTQKGKQGPTQVRQK